MDLGALKGLLARPVDARLDVLARVYSCGVTALGAEALLRELEEEGGATVTSTTDGPVDRCAFACARVQCGACVCRQLLVGTPAVFREEFSVHCILGLHIRMCVCLCVFVGGQRLRGLRCPSSRERASRCVWARCTSRSWTSPIGPHPS